MVWFFNTKRKLSLQKFKQEQRKYMDKYINISYNFQLFYTDSDKNDNFVELFK